MGYVTVLLFSVALVLVIGLKRQPRDPFDPLWGVLLVLAALFGLRPLLLLFGSDSFVDIRETDISYAVFLGGIVGLASFCIGYLSPWLRRYAARVPIPTSPSKLRGRILLLAYLSLAALALWGLNERIPLSESVSGGTIAAAFALKSGGGYVVSGIVLIPVLFAAFASMRLFARAYRPSRLTVLLLLTVSLVTGWLMGVRMESAKAVAMGILLWLAARRKPISFKHLILLSPVIILLLWAFLVPLNQLRNYGSVDWGLALDPRSSLEVLSSALIPFDVFSFLVGRMRNGMEPLWGMPYLTTLLTPIPRSWWPGKPVISVEYLFTERFFYDPLDRVRGATLTLTIPGELYWEGLVVGIILGMAFYGFVLRTVYEYRNLNRANWFAEAVHAWFYLTSVKAFYSSFQTWLIMVVLLGVLAWAPFLFLASPKLAFPHKPARL